MEQKTREAYEAEIQQLADKIIEAIKCPPQKRETHTSTLEDDIKKLVIAHSQEMILEIAKYHEDKKCSG